ncbi:MAG: hypothetical protein Q8P56_02610 [Candidatus Uhrbacteria bacterium]|nr:hypothetical protein [Candidatus Uhrbacteria bacterium]
MEKIVDAPFTTPGPTTKIEYYLPSREEYEEKFDILSFIEHEGYARSGEPAANWILKNGHLESVSLIQAVGATLSRGIAFPGTRYRDKKGREFIPYLRHRMVCNEGVCETVWELVHLELRLLIEGRWAWVSLFIRFP